MAGPAFRISANFTGRAAALVLVGCVVSLSCQSTALSQDADAQFAKTIQPLLKQYCWECHSGASAEEGLRLDSFPNVAAMKQRRDHWRKILKMIDAGAMPPADVDQPTKEERRQIVDWIDQSIFYVDCSQLPDPGRVTVRRLNRVEYNNTVRDLFHVTSKPADDFPSDDVGEGFDNIGDVLSLPPLLLEKYLNAAESVAAEAVLAPSPNARITANIEQWKTEGSAQNRDGIVVMASRGSVTAKFDVPVAGTYILRIVASGDLAGDELPIMEVVAGRSTRNFRVEKQRPSSSPYTLEVGVSAGEFVVKASFTNDFYDPKAKRNGDRNLYIHEMTLLGPTKISSAPSTELQRAVAKRRPKDSKNRQQVADNARIILRTVASRGFRRTVDPAELDRLVKLVELAVVDRGESFERGIQVGLTAILVSPHFLFRVERHSAPDDPTKRLAIDGFELASRLSYFLWSSMPDHELFIVARSGELHKPEVLKKQIARMLADPKAEALVVNFAGQWLNLRNLDEVAPSAKKFQGFDDELRNDMREESYALFRAIMQDNHPVTEFLNANYSFINARLAKLYGIAGVSGGEFRRVRLPANRRGIVTHASILTLTSNPTRTSPVKRGKWILENLLGTPPPEPPADVPNLEDAKTGNPNATLREQLEVHRQDPSCAVCHREMDAIGLALENFNAIGRWRDAYENGSIDAQGTLPTGESFRSSQEMLKILANREQQFCRCLSEKMLTYALGRGLEYYDRCAVDDIVKHLEASEFRFTALVEGIVLSDAFLKRRGEQPN
jgi:hypothetical protein